MISVGAVGISGWRRLNLNHAPVEIVALHELDHPPGAQREHVNARRVLPLHHLARVQDASELVF